MLGNAEILEHVSLLDISLVAIYHGKPFVYIPIHDDILIIFCYVILSLYCCSQHRVLLHL